MTVECRVVSIGTLSHNRLWGEGAAVRTAHATTTLVTDDDRRLLVDPGLPATALAARFAERTGSPISTVTDVFCTTLRPAHRRGIHACDDARWWAAEDEIETYRDHLVGLLDAAERAESDDVAAIRSELELVRRFRPAPDKLSPQVNLYPLKGPSPGSSGLLLTPPTQTIVVAGDAVATADHLLAGQVWKGCVDTEAALESLQDVLEIADAIICGHDNLIICPRRWM